MKDFRVYIRYEEFEGKDVTVDYEFMGVRVKARDAASAINKASRMVSAKA